MTATISLRLQARVTSMKLLWKLEVLPVGWLVGSPELLWLLERLLWLLVMFLDSVKLRFL
ncbi:MAG: hypothetical protein CML23_03945 [Rhizobiaceae bacterium]|nr:hypothetical protein [Rhizobiaceae bacterium]